MNFNKFDPKKNNIKTIYHLMISGIAPRPIALVSSIDKNGVSNLAPFSFFNGFGANPPIVGFSPAISGKTGLPKDTLLNIKETKEFTISIITSSMVEQISLASCEFERNIDEFIKSGLTKRKSNYIVPPGVSQSPFIMECKLHSIIELGGKPASGNLILGEVVLFHVSKDIISKDTTIDPYQIDQVGRSGGSWYTEIKKSLFSFKKPSRIGIGFDTIPNEFLNSTLTGNQLAQLASISEVPSLKENDNCIKEFDFVLDSIINHLKNNKIEEAWQIILNWIKYNE